MWPLNCVLRLLRRAAVSRTLKTSVSSLVIAFLSESVFIMGHWWCYTWMFLYLLQRFKWKKFQHVQNAPKTSRTSRHPKRTGSSPDVPTESNFYHFLRQEEKMSPRERSTSKGGRTEESNKQSKITDFTGSGPVSYTHLRAHETS